MKDYDLQLGTVGKRVLGETAQMNAVEENILEETRLLTCPVRGKLSASSLAKDGVTPTEEARRIEFINLLIRRGYQGG